MLINIILVVTIILLIPIAVLSSKHHYSKGWRKGYSEGWEEAGGENIPFKDRIY